MGRGLQCFLIVVRKRRNVGCRRGIRIRFRLFFFPSVGQYRGGMTGDLMSNVSGSNERNNERYEPMRGTHLQSSQRWYRKEGRRRYCRLRSVGNDIGLWLVITPLGPDHRPLFMQARDVWLYVWLSYSAGYLYNIPPVKKQQLSLPEVCLIQSRALFSRDYRNLLEIWA